MSLDAELALDLVDARLAKELPAHVRAFAQAYARGEPGPMAPPVLAHRATLAAALVACTHPELAARGLALLRLVAPLVIEADASVAAIRARVPSWAGYAALRQARDRAAAAHLDHDFATVIHDLHGSNSVTVGAVADAPPVAAWTTEEAAIEAGTIAAAWPALAARFGVGGQVAIVHASARPRAFVVVPGREAIVVVPERVATPAARFAVLHELGHAIAALAIDRALPRVVDEAVASLVARTMEVPGAAWASPLAIAARARRHAIAARLDAIERGGAIGDLATPPWALWHDAGAQAAYVAAEAIADELAAASPAAFRAMLDAVAARIDRATPV